MSTTQLPQTTTFHAPDIHCDGCAASITRALGKTPGALSAQVDVDLKTVTVTHTTPASDIAAALDDMGFPATVSG